MAGNYSDDHDAGDVIDYTGMGGQDSNGRQVESLSARNGFRMFVQDTLATFSPVAPMRNVLALSVVHVNETDGGSGLGEGKPSAEAEL